MKTIVKILASIVIVFLMFTTIGQSQDNTGKYKTRIPSKEINEKSYIPKNTSSLIDNALMDNTINRDQWARYMVYALFDEAKLPPQFHGTVVRGWATPKLLELQQQWQNISDETKRELVRYHFTINGVLERPSWLPEATGNDHFLVHYSINLADTNYVSPIDMNANGIPDYVDTVLAALDTVWNTEIVSSGYYSPISDSGIGGDQRFDIYIEKLDGDYGVTTGEKLIGNNPNSPYAVEHNAYRGYIEIANDYSQYTVKGSTAIRATLAHEFFHLVQYSYNTLEQIWLMEATATWMEGVVFPYLRTGLEYLPSWFQHPQWSLERVLNNHEYGSWIFFRYISEHAGGDDIIRLVWNASVTNDRLPGDNSFRDIATALQSAPKGFQTFKDVFAGFTTTNLLKVIPPFDYFDGVLYPGVKITAVVNDTATLLDNAITRHSSQYYQIGPAMFRDSLLTVQFSQIDPQTRFATQLVILRGNNSDIRPFNQRISLIGDPTIDSMFLIVMNYDSIGWSDYKLEFRKTHDLQIFITAPATISKDDGKLTYAFFYRYNGVDTLKNVILRDSLSEQTEYFSSTGGGSCSNRMVKWNLGNLTQSDTFQSVTSTVSFAVECGKITNRMIYAEVDSSYRVYCPSVVTEITGGNCYTITEIKAPEIYQLGGVVRINGSGKIAGYYPTYTQQDGYHEIVFSGDSLGIYPLPHFSGNLSSPRVWDINEDGDIVGEDITATGQTHAILWRGFTMIDLNPMLGNPLSSTANAINDSGWIAGSYDGENYLYKNGEVPLNDTSFSAVRDVNNARQVVGGIYVTGNWHACISENSVVTDLNSQFGYTNSIALEINSSGHFVGWSGMSHSNSYGFLYRNGDITQVSPLHGEADGINDSDWVVGMVWQTSSSDGYGFLYKDDRHINLNHRIPNETGWKLQEATDINNRGQIVGWGLYYGKSVLFLLTPPLTTTGVEEPIAEGIPKSFELNQNYPNPFNPSTTIKYQLPVDSRVSLNVFNLLGQVVAVLADEEQKGGFKSVVLNVNNLASGVYFYRLKAMSISDPNKSFTQVKKMVLLK
jgi:probable HAF family extracellular repeat protein